MAAFTYLWTNRCRTNMLDAEGEPLDCMAGNMFTKRGVQTGDEVYVVGIWKGNVYLICRITVRQVWSREDWDAEHQTPRLWEGEEVAECVDGTLMRMHRTLLASTLQQLRFLDGKGREKGLAMTDGELDDAQCLRSVRRLSPRYAELLDEVLGE
ncbi:hypothetical protein J0H58_19480 [bacterium]|nr:hypothetical protein [bacterium]